MAILFQKSKDLEYQIDTFLDLINDGMLVFKSGVGSYLFKNKDDFAERIIQIDKCESTADKLRRDIESKLYNFSLIPEHRGDVLGLLETLDHVIDTAKKTLTQFDVEIPDIPEEFNEGFKLLAEASVLAAEALVFASRSFFKDINQVKDHLHKVYFYEKEADRISDKLKRRIFRSDLKQSHKMHLRYFALHVETISDRAEEVADRLSIYTIKREI